MNFIEADFPAPLAPTSNLKAAICLVQCGFFVFPLWRVVDAKCEAPWKHECKPGKHSRIKSWTKLASTDLTIISKWWRRWPRAGIGIATGRSGLAVLDVDSKNGGLESFDALCKTVPDLADYPAKVETGSGGFHLYFAQPENGEVRNTESRIARGIDTRGIGGYVVAPPSIHANGKPYRWITPLEFPLRPFPPELQAYLAPNGEADETETKKSIVPFTNLSEDVVIPEGARNGCFASYAGRLRVAGLDPEEMFLFLKWLRDGHCENPKSFADDEIRSIIRMSFTYERVSLFAHVRDWITAGVSASTIKYLSTIAIAKAQNIWSPSIKWIRDFSGMAKSTQLKCRAEAVEKQLIVSENGVLGKSARIEFLPPRAMGPGISPIVKARNEKNVTDSDLKTKESRSENPAALRPQVKVSERLFGSRRTNPRTGKSEAKRAQAREGVHRR